MRRNPAPTPEVTAVVDAAADEVAAATADAITTEPTPAVNQEQIDLVPGAEDMKPIPDIRPNLPNLDAEESALVRLARRNKIVNPTGKIKVGARSKSLAERLKDKALLMSTGADEYRITDTGQYLIDNE